MSYAIRGTQLITDWASGTLTLFIKKKISHVTDVNTELFSGEYAYADELIPVVKAYLKQHWAAMLSAKNVDNPSLYKFYRDEQAIATDEYKNQLIDCGRAVRLKTFGSYSRIKDVWL